MARRNIAVGLVALAACSRAPALPSDTPPLVGIIESELRLSPGKTTIGSLPRPAGDRVRIELEPEVDGVGKPVLARLVHEVPIGFEDETVEPWARSPRGGVMALQVLFPDGEPAHLRVRLRWLHGSVAAAQVFAAPADGVTDGWSPLSTVSFGELDDNWSATIAIASPGLYTLGYQVGTPTPQDASGIDAGTPDVGSTRPDAIDDAAMSDGPSGDDGNNADTPDVPANNEVVLTFEVVVDPVLVANSDKWREAIAPYIANLLDSTERLFPVGPGHFSRVLRLKSVAADEWQTFTGDPTAARDQPSVEGRLRLVLAARVVEDAGVAVDAGTAEDAGVVDETTSRRGAIIQLATFTTPDEDALTLAHEIGHLLGAQDLTALENTDTDPNLPPFVFQAPESIMTRPSTSGGVFDQVSRDIIDHHLTDPSYPDAFSLVPSTVGLRVVSLFTQLPVAGATVRLYPKPCASARIVGSPRFTGTTDAKGEYLLPASPFGKTFRDGICVYLAEATLGGYQSYRWLTLLGAQESCLAGTPYVRTTDVGRGDSNGDGTVDITDALLAAQDANKSITLSPPYYAACADVNCDGLVSESDANIIAGATAGLLASSLETAACLYK